MRFNFNLRQVKDENKETPIYLVMSINGRQEKFATGQKVCPKFWEKGKSLAIVSNTQPRKIQQHNKSVNDELSKITAKMTMWNNFPKPFLLFHSVQVFIQGSCRQSQ